MKDIKYITPPEKCTGCGLCANVCSKDAIRMEWSKEGFLVPQVDVSACVNCGLCVKMCPAQPGAMNNESYTDDIEAVVAYGGWNVDGDTHRNSSSGGVFSALAKQVFTAGGCVFGVVWKDKLTATFAKAENMVELEPMRGSKYTQAEPGNVYRDVKTELQKGRHVLFTGTACQVYALKKYLRRDYANLLTFDIVCHGVPSRKLLQAYVKHYEYVQGKELKEVYFRFKDDNWQGYNVQKRFIDGSVLNHVNSQDMFMNLFIGDYMLNKACYNCPHAHLPRPGDMTLGDYWGNLQAMHPEWPIKEGIGSLVANSDKGKAVLEKLSREGKITLHREPFINLYKGQMRSYLRDKNHIVPNDRAIVLTIIDTMPIEKLHNRYYNSIQLGPFIFKKNGFIDKSISRAKRIIIRIKHSISF